MQGYLPVPPYSYLRAAHDALQYPSDNDLSKASLPRFYDYSLLKIHILTGRKNQIRVHMKENNTPVVGDKKYGRKDTYSRLMLHAYELSFIHPKTKHKFKFSVPIPKDFLNLF